MAKYNFIYESDDMIEASLHALKTISELSVGSIYFSNRWKGPRRLDAVLTSDDLAVVPPFDWAKSLQGDQYRIWLGFNPIGSAVQPVPTPYNIRLS